MSTSTMLTSGTLSTSTMLTSAQRTGWLQWTQHLLARFVKQWQRETQITHWWLLNIPGPINFESKFLYFGLKQKFTMWFADNTANVSQSDDTPAGWVVNILTGVKKQKRLKNNTNISHKNAKMSQSQMSGTRGQSRYHYYGLAVKETSPYYDPGEIFKDLKRRSLMQIFQPSPLSKGGPSSTQVPFYILEWF